MLEERREELFFCGEEGLVELDGWRLLSRKLLHFIIIIIEGNHECSNCFLIVLLCLSDYL